MVVVLQAILVAHNLSIEFVYQFIHGCVEILMGTLCKHVATFDMDIALGTLPSFLFLLLLNGE